jgi:hypothetical protein
MRAVGRVKRGSPSTRCRATGTIREPSFPQTGSRIPGDRPHVRRVNLKFLSLSWYPHAGRCAIRLVRGCAARFRRDSLGGNTVRSRLRAADRRGRRLFGHAFDRFWGHRIRLGLPSNRRRRRTGTGCRRNAGVSADHTARRGGVFQSRSRIIRRNAFPAGSI